MGCYIWYSEEGPGQAATPPSPLIAVPNVTPHPSTASVYHALFCYDGPLLCGFNVAIKGLNFRRQLQRFSYTSLYADAPEADDLNWRKNCVFLTSLSQISVGREQAVNCGC